MPEDNLAGKRFFTISEVSQIVGVEPYVLRYWEKEFKEIRPTRFSSRRLYTQQDINTLLMIKKLLYEEGFTILGAKRHLNQCLKRRSLIQEIKTELQQVLDLLRYPDSKA